MIASNVGSSPTRNKIPAKILAAVVTLCLAAAGCSSSDRPEIGEVTGVVTLDGKPLPRASISFNKPGFRSSIGNTDEQGRYELIYIRDIRGAAIGKHEVKIKVFGADGNRGLKIPARYNSKSELTADVKSGHNEFNFDLKSDS